MGLGQYETDLAVYGRKILMTKSSIKERFDQQEEAAQKVIRYFLGRWRLRKEARGVEIPKYLLR
jgi:regulator of sirC expression with transglutaminase-like and TPR domain